MAAICCGRCRTATADAEGLFATSLAATPQGHVVVGAANDDSGAMNSGRVFIYNGTDGALIKIIDNPEPEANVNFGQGLAVTPSGQIAVGAFGADGGFGKLYLFTSISEGEPLTPVNELPFSDSALQACVFNEAASNGWSTVDEVTALNCANGDVTDLTGLDALTDLDTLDLSGNTDLQCSDLDALEAALPNTAITRPATCNNGSSTQAQQVQNLHNAQGQRVVKTVNGNPATAVHFIYDQSGQVIAEIDAATGQTLREYIYVNGQQIALVDDTGTSEEETYFVHNDHLGTPQKITDETQAIVWDATYQPFGEVEVATAEIENNIRFPGQYADGETGLHYNYFRDYDPSTGRYVQSDPIGLNGGPNLYVYALSNSITYFDPLGLCTCIAKGENSIGDKDSRYIPRWWGSQRIITCTYECTSSNGSRSSVRGTHKEWYLRKSEFDRGFEGDCIGAVFASRMTRDRGGNAVERYYRVNFESFNPAESSSIELRNWADQNCCS